MTEHMVLRNITRGNVTTAAAQARERTADKRWLSAIARAQVALEAPCWSFDGQHMQIRGTTGTKYVVTPNVCQCRAFEIGRPCYHRAAITLLIHASRLPVLESRVERVVRVSPAEAIVDAWNERATDYDMAAMRDAQALVDEITG